MVSSGSPNQYRLKVSPTLLSQLMIMGVDGNELVEFIHSQIQTLISCPPNFRVAYSKSIDPTLRIWILRGYYPETPIFFKLSLVKATDGGPYSYYAKASHLMVNMRRKWGEKNSTQYGEFHFNSSDIDKKIVESMENSLLGADHEPKKHMTGGPRAPKCMSPKGMKLFRYKKPSNRRKCES